MSEQMGLVRVVPVTSKVVKPRTYGKGRVCARGDCDTQLSMYNKREFCAQHSPRRRPRVRGHEAPEHLPRCQKCAARARGRLDEFMEIEVAYVIHREGIDGAAILCEGSLGTDLDRPNLSRP